jgi:biotin operon repressor
MAKRKKSLQSRLQAGEFISKSDLAEYLGISTKTLRRRIEPIEPKLKKIGYTIGMKKLSPQMIILIQES